MKKKVILLISVIIILMIGATALFIVRSNNKDDETVKGNQVDNQNVIENVEEFVPDEIPNINGIPEYLFETKVEFPLILKNNQTGEINDILTTSVFTDFFEYLTLEEQAAGFEQPDDLEVPKEMPLKPGTTDLYVKTIDKEETLDGVFVFGAVNESEEDLYFPDCRTIFISYYGSSDWELCGIKTKMTMEQVKEAIGEPTQEYVDIDSENVYEYHMLKDEHTYSFLVEFDTENCVDKMSLNIDNHPVHYDIAEQ